VKVEKDSQELPSRVQFPSFKVEQHAFQVNLKGKVDKQLSMFTFFFKITNNQGREKEKEACGKGRSRKTPSHFNFGSTRKNNSNL
jgi:hypothetical protein